MAAKEPTTIREANAATKRVLGALRALCNAVLLHLRDLDAEMRQPSSQDRGRRIGIIASRLEFANDQARYAGGLGIDFRSDPGSKRRETALAAKLDPWTARPLSEWHEDVGPVLWWFFPIVEPPYSGSPLDTNWPGYHTHWTPLIEPIEPPTTEKGEERAD